MSVATKNQSLLAAYLHQLATHPLRTKSITAGTLCFVQEILASHIAREPRPAPPKDAPAVEHVLTAAKVDSKALKMAIYGSCVSAPLGHYLVGLLQRSFAGKTGTGAKIAQILCSNLLVAPIQTTVYLTSIAIIGGARSVDEVLRTVKGGFMAVMRMTWLSSPLAMVFAQKVLPQELWVPFFNLVGFVLGTYFTTLVKKRRIAEAKKPKKE